MKLYVISVLSLVLVANSALAELNLRPCHMKDPKVNACLKDKIYALYKYVNDVKKEPLASAVDNIRVKHAPINLESLNLRGSFDEMSFHGGAKFSIMAVKSDLSKLRADLKLQIPKVESKGLYKLNGYAVLPINAAGNFQGILNGVTVLVKLYMKREKNPVDNEIYLSLDNINVDYAVKDVRFKLNEQASKPLEQIYTSLINEHSALFLNEIKPQVLNLFKDSFSYIFQSSLQSIPEKFVITQ